MLDLAYEKGVKNPQFRSFFNGFPSEFFLFLRQGLRSYDVLYRTKAFKVNADLLEDLDDQIEEIAEKTGSKKGIVYSLLFHSMEKMNAFSQIRDFCKEHRLAYGDKALEKFLSNIPKMKSDSKKAIKLLPKGKRI